MHGSNWVPDLRDYKRAWVGKGKTINESEMALFSECSLRCARKVLDTADIVREAIFRQLWAAHCAVGLARYAGSIPAVVRFQAKQKTLQHAKCARAFS